MNRIKSLNELKKLADGESVECSISLGKFGGVSSKIIWYDSNDDEWEIYHMMDDSEENFKSTEDMLENTHIELALKHGALYVG